MEEKGKAEKQSPITHFGDKIKTWRPGQSGNPAGRPKHTVFLSEALRKLLEEIPKGELEGRRAIELIALALLREGYKGNIPAIREIFDRVEGKVTAIIDLGSGEGRAINISFIEVKEGEDNAIQRQGITEGSGEEGSSEA